MAKLGEAAAKARKENPVGNDFSEALARGLRVMNILGTTSHGMTLSEAAAIVDMPRATVRRTLLTLVHLGYVEEEGRLFRLTPQVLSLAGAYIGSNIATSILQPLCERLSLEHGITFSVAVLDGADTVMIAYSRPRSLYMESGGIGLRLPAHCSAAGRILLAAMTTDRRNALLSQYPLRQATPRTTMDRKALDRILAEVGNDGYAQVDEEVEMGYHAIAVPVRRSSGSIGFALGVGLSAHRAPADEMKERYLPILLAAAAELSGQLL